VGDAKDAGNDSVGAAFWQAMHDHVLGDAVDYGDGSSDGEQRKDVVARPGCAAWLGVELSGWVFVFSGHQAWGSVPFVGAG